MRKSRSAIAPTRVRDEWFCAAQSVKLSYYEERVDAIIKANRQLPEELAS